MKSKTSATITPDKAAAPEGSAGLADGQTADVGNRRLSNAAPFETAGKAVATPEAPISNEKVVADAVEAFDVRPSETVSIVAGNRVLFLGEGLKEIRITR